MIYVAISINETKSFRFRNGLKGIIFFFLDFQIILFVLILLILRVIKNVTLGTYALLDYV